MTFKWVNSSTEFISLFFFSHLTLAVSFSAQDFFFNELPRCEKGKFFHVSSPVLLSSINFEMIFNFVI